MPPIVANFRIQSREGLTYADTQFVLAKRSQEESINHKNIAINTISCLWSIALTVAAVVGSLFTAKFLERQFKLPLTGVTPLVIAMGVVLIAISISNIALKTLGKHVARVILLVLRLSTVWRASYVNQRGNGLVKNEEIPQLLHSVRSIRYQKELLGQMNMTQLRAARAAMGVKSFQKATEGQGSPFIQLWKTVDALLGLQDLQKGKELIARLGLQKDRPNFFQLMRLLEQELKKNHKKELLQELYQIAPFLKPVIIRFKDNVCPPLTVREETLRYHADIVNCIFGDETAALLDQGKPLPDEVVCDKDSFEYGELDAYNRILKRFSEEHVDATLDQWLADLLYAHKRLNKEGLEKLETLLAKQGIVDNFEDHCKVVSTLQYIHLNDEERKKVQSLQKMPETVLKHFSEKWREFFPKIGSEIAFSKATDFAERHNLKELQKYLLEKGPTLVKVDQMYHLFKVKEIVEKLNKISFSPEEIKQIFAKYENLNDAKAKAIVELCLKFVAGLTEEIRLQTWGPYIPKRRKP